MFDSLPYRNDAAIVFRRLIRSLPTRTRRARRGHLRQGTARHDDGAGRHAATCRACWFPAASRCCPNEGEDAGKVQSIGARFAHGEITLEEAAEVGCRACASPGGGCQFLGTAATSQVVGEALGLALPHSALAPSGQPIWLDMARRSARAVLASQERGLTTRHILTDAALRNAMVVHAAFGGSTNLLLHLPADRPRRRTARAPPSTTGRRQSPGAAPGRRAAQRPAQLSHRAVVFLAGGVPEVMLHLRRAGLLDLDALTASA